jgi:hypothetical protein
VSEHDENEITDIPEAAEADAADVGAPDTEAEEQNDTAEE